MNPLSLGRRLRTRGALRAVLAALAFAMLTVVVPVPGQTAQAVDNALFDPGFIISDTLFFDRTAMTAEEIDAFIDEKNPGCATGRVCIENYREDITAKAASSYYGCEPIAAAEDQTAGQIIAAAAQACGISPMAIVVILQKEQSLITSTAPSARAFNYAMGAGCPDTAPCDEDYAGFYENVYYGAKLLKGYTLPHSTHYNRYAAGQTSSIYYHPNTSCGSKSVAVANQATHALYVYTPYTPNATVLAGGSDSCSAYGNYNFWRLYNSWFGPTRTSDSLMTADGTSSTFLVTPNGKYRFATLPQVGDFSGLGDVAHVSKPFLDSLPLLGEVTSMVKDSNTNEYFIVDRGQKIPLNQCSGGGQGHLLRYSCGAAPSMTTAQLDAIPTAAPMSNLLRTPSGLQYFLDADGKHAYMGSRAVEQSGHEWPGYATVVREGVIDRVPLAATFMGDGRAATVGSDIFFRSGDSYGQVSPQLWNQAGMSDLLREPVSMDPQTWMAPESTTVTGLMSPGSTSDVFMLRSGGLMQLAADDVSGANVTEVDDDLLAQLPVLPFSTDFPRFIRDAATSKLYWTDGSTRRFVQSTSDRGAIADLTGIAAQTMTVPTDTVRAFPPGGGPLLPPGTVARDTSTGDLWYLDGLGLKWRMPESRAQEFTTGAIRNVGASELSAYADRGIYAAMGLSCMDGLWMNSGGVRYAISAEDAAHLAPGYKFYNYEDSTCAAMPLGDQTATRLLTDGQGRYYYVTDGARSQIHDTALRDQLIADNGQPVVVSKAVLRLFQIAPTDTVG